MKQNWKEDGAVGKKGGKKREEEGWEILTTSHRVAPDSCRSRGQCGAGGAPYSDSKKG